MSLQTVEDASASPRLLVPAVSEDMPGLRSGTTSPVTTTDGSDADDDNVADSRSCADAESQVFNVTLANSAVRTGRPWQLQPESHGFCPCMRDERIHWVRESLGRRAVFDAFPGGIGVKDDPA